MAANEQYKIVVTIDGNDQISATLDKTNQKLKETTKATDDGKASAKSWGEQWGVSSAGLLAATAVIAGAVIQLNALGTQANAAEKTFNQVTGGAEQAAASLARMRQSTGGIIDDMTLMKGASSLLVTGIAQTNEQAEELVNLGSRLSAVMGVDAAEGIQNLNSALLNNSFMRLDTLGISAAAVRERVNELKEAGMDMSAAFSQAVLEIGTQTLTDLGGAAAVAETSVNRLKTSFDNMAQNLGQIVNVEIEKMATTLEQIGTLWSYFTTGNTGIADIDARIAATNELIAVTDDYIAIREYNLNTQGVSTSDPMLGDVTAESAVTYAQANAGQVPTISTGHYFTDAIAGDSADIAEARRILEELLGFSLDNRTSQELIVVARDADIAFASITEAQAELALQTQATTDAQAQQVAQIEAQQTALTDFNSIEAQAVDNLAAMRDMSTSLTDSLSAGSFSSSSGMAFFDREQLAGVQSDTQAIVDEYERLKALGEGSDFTLVSELDVERARTIAEQAQETAEQSERNAAAWEKASLAMIAGATGGGRLNEFNQMVLAQIEDPELRAQAEQQFNLASGVETANTQVLDYGANLVTQITEEQGIAAGTRAGQDFVTAFEEGIRLGLEGEALQDYVEEQVGYAIVPDGQGTGTGTGSQQVQVQAGEGYIALAQRTGISREELEAATGGGMLMAGQIIQVGDGSSLVAVNGDPEDIQTTESALTGILTGIINGGGTPPATTDTGTTPLSDYTYWDPVTGTATGVNDTMTTGNQQGSMFPPEMAETTSTMADDMLQVENSVATISQTDLTETLDPLVTDIESASATLTEFEDGLTRVQGANWAVEVPISFVFNEQTAELLSRNSQVVETVRLILPQLGITPT